MHRRGRKQHKCDYCCRSFSKIENLKEHKLEDHSNTSPTSVILDEDEFKDEYSNSSQIRANFESKNENQVSNEFKDEDEISNQSQDEDKGLKNQNKGKLMTIECALCSIVITAPSRHFKTKFNR